MVGKTTSKKIRADKIRYHSVSPSLITLTGRQIYPGDTIAVYRTSHVQVGDLVVIWQPETKNWKLGVWRGRVRGQIKLDAEFYGKEPYPYYVPSNEWSIYGRIVEVDAFFDIEYVEEMPNGTTNKSGIAESDLTM